MQLSHAPKFKTVYEIRDLNGNIKRTHIPKEKVDEAFVTISVMTPEGVIKKHIKKPFKSYVANFGRLLQHSWFTTANGGSTGDNMIIEALTGGATKIATSAFTMAVNEAALTSPTQTVFGIWIGDKDNQSGLALPQESGIGGDVHYNDYMLRTLMLADGGSPDTGMEYRAVNVSMPDGNTLRISRRFQNDSVLDIIVDECGMIGKSAGTEYFLIARDMLIDDSDPITGNFFTVEPADILEVTYEFTISNQSGLTQNWLKYLSSLFVSGNAVSQPKDVNGSLYTVSFASARTQQDLNAVAHAITHGIVIGGYASGEIGAITGPFATTDYKLTDILLDAELDYSAMAVELIELKSEYYQIGFYRDFENDRADNKTVFVKESGIYMKELAAAHYFMLARDVVDGTGYIQVNKDEILRVKCYFQFPI